MAPRQTAGQPQYLDDDHQRLVEFAEWAYEDDPEERAVFLDYHMERRGYTRTSGWAAPQPPPPDAGGQGGDGGPAGPGKPRPPAYFKR